MALTLTQELISDFSKRGSDNQNSNTPTRADKVTQTRKVIYTHK
jgi:hypothetical protein